MQTVRQFWRMALKPSPSLTTRHQHWPALPGGSPGKPHVLVRVRVGQGARVRVDQWGAGWRGCELVLGRVDSKPTQGGVVNGGWGVGWTVELQFT